MPGLRHLRENMDYSVRIGTTKEETWNHGWTPFFFSIAEGRARRRAATAGVGSSPYLKPLLKRHSASPTLDGLHGSSQFASSDFYGHNNDLPVL